MSATTPTQEDRELFEMSNEVARIVLKHLAPMPGFTFHPVYVTPEATGPLIECLSRLRRENETMREALKAYIAHAEEQSEMMPCCAEVLAIARAAMESKP